MVAQRAVGALAVIERFDVVENLGASLGARLHRAMELIRRKTLPQGLLGQAIDYTLKRWDALTWLLGDGTLEIDNNLINAARGINQVMPRPILCRAAELEWHFKEVFGLGEQMCSA